MLPYDQLRTTATIWPAEDKSYHMIRWGLKLPYDQMRTTTTIWPAENNSYHMTSWEQKLQHDQPKTQATMWPNEDKSYNTRNVSMGHGCPRYCQIRINRKLSLTKGKNSWRHDAIRDILKIKDIMVLNNVTMFHRIIIKTIQLREQTSFQPTIFHKLRAITPSSMVPYRPLSNLKKTSWYLTMWPSFIKFWSKLFTLESGII